MLVYASAVYKCRPSFLLCLVPIFLCIDLFKVSELTSNLED